MKQYLKTLKQVPLFKDVEESDMELLWDCLSPKLLDFESGEVIFQVGAPAETVGIVLEGAVKVSQDDYQGNRNIIAAIKKGQLFSESFAYADIEQMPVTVIAAEKSVILLIDYRKIITTCGKACKFHNQLVLNMVRVLANKNVILSQKLNITSKRSTREKAMAYLTEVARINEKKVFEIPFNRQELADYLSVDRSALSAELGKLRKEGKIDFHKNTFRLCGKSSTERRE